MPGEKRYRWEMRGMPETAQHCLVEVDGDISAVAGIWALPEDGQRRDPMSAGDWNVSLRTRGLTHSYLRFRDKTVLEVRWLAVEAAKALREDIRVMDWNGVVAG